VGYFEKTIIQEIVTHMNIFIQVNHL
jgi:hypothetical protein